MKPDCWTGGGKNREEREETNYNFKREGGSPTRTSIRGTSIIHLRQKKICFHHDKEEGKDSKRSPIKIETPTSSLD